jgi:hypothetical protein
MTTELVKQEGAREVEEAEAVQTQIKAALADGREALWRLAEALYAFDDMRGWRRLGYRTLSEWLADTDETITRGTYYRLVGTWRRTVVELKVDAGRVRQLDQSKVAIVVGKTARKGMKVDDALADAEALGAQALRIKYGKARRGRRPLAEPAQPAQPAQPATTPTVSSGHEPATEVLPSAPAPSPSPAIVAGKQTHKEAATSTTARAELRGCLGELAALSAALVVEEAAGVVACGIEVKVILLEAAAAEARSAAGKAVEEEG